MGTFWIEPLVSVSRWLSHRIYGQNFLKALESE